MESIKKRKRIKKSYEKVLLKSPSHDQHQRTNSKPHEQV
jgi:hypothetical protein